MTRINRLVCQGFKSFGKRVELVFGPSFNCILGPNGSGKSNVMDAICFVLGKSSAKSMRAEKAANLIFNGGKSKKGAGQGEVSIYFDNADKTFPTEDQEVKITRIVKKDGGSKYKINDQPRTRNQIIDLLAMAKIDPDGYNIILQGDIVRLVEMSPIERRLIIEEIAGISIYEEKKNQALLELDKVEKRLTEATIVLKERETYLKELKADRNQALKFKQLNDKIRSNKASYLKIQMNRKEKEISEIEERMVKYRTEIEKYRNEIAQLRVQIEEKKKEIEKITKEIETKGEKDQIEFQKELELARVQLATSKTKITSHSQEIERTKQRTEQLLRNKQELEKKIQSNNDEKAAYTTQKGTVQKELSDIEEKTKAFKKKHNIEEQTAELEKQTDLLDKRIEELQNKINRLREEQQDLLRKKDRAELEIRVMDDKISKVKEVEKQHKDEMETLAKKRDAFKQLTLELNKLLTEGSNVATELADLKNKLTQASENLARLQAKNAGIRERMSSSEAVKAIIENRKKLGGIHGTVADLGDVPGEYSLALEIAGGARINSIVVENDTTAAKCIQFLREKKLGRATFLPLNKIKGKGLDEEAKKAAKSKDVLGLAINLVTFDQKYAHVFSYVFESTLVVKSLQTTQDLGIGKYRMVTLDGDLTEHSGAMHGGYSARKASAFREKELTEEISGSESAVAKIEGRIFELTKQREINEKAITELRSRKAELEGDIIKTERGLHIDESDLEASKAYKKKLQEELAEHDKKLRELDEEIRSDTMEIAKAKTERLKTKDQMNQLKNPVLLAELNAFETRKEQLKERLVKAEAEIKTIDVQNDNILMPEIQSITKILTDQEKEIKKFEGEIAELKARVQKEETELKAKEEKQKELFAKFKDLFEARSKHSNDLSKLENSSILADDRARGEEYKANTLSLEQAKIKAELAGLTEEYVQYEGVELDLEKPEEQMKNEIRQFEKLQGDLGSVNMRALEIYETVEREFNSLLEKKEVLSKEKGDVEKLINEIEGKKTDLFLKTFEAIDHKFRDIFTKLTTKGSEAFIELENKETPLLEGVRIRVKISGDKFLDIRSLSGGEKTMTALAFIFAIQEYEPAKFYVLDEVDAALDKHNSEKFSNLIHKYAENAQYLIISHNDTVISKASVLYGVSMNEHGISNVISLKV